MQKKNGVMRAFRLCMPGDRQQDNTLGADISVAVENFLDVAYIFRLAQSGRARNVFFK